MADISYRDLAEFGLPLVPPVDPSFRDLVRGIQSGPYPLPAWDMTDASESAALLNNSGKAIVVLGYMWRYTRAAGTTYTSQFSNLGSSMQMDVLSGRQDIVRDLGSFILPGSKRLLTANGMYGTNLDVLPPDSAAGGGSIAGFGGGGRRATGEQIARTELILDTVIFEDGLCAGPDESGLFETLTEELAWQRDTAIRIIAALRNGATAGQVFDMLRASAPGVAPGAGRRLRPLREIFKRMAVNHMMNASDSGLLSWFERIAQSSPLRLHRPS